MRRDWMRVWSQEMSRAQSHAVPVPLSGLRVKSPLSMNIHSFKG